MSFYAILNQLMYKNLLKNTTNINLGDKNELNFAWKVILSFIWVSSFT